MRKITRLIASAVAGVMISLTVLPVCGAEKTLPEKNIQVTVSPEDQQEIKGWGATPGVCEYLSSYEQSYDAQVFVDFGLTIIRYPLSPDNGNWDGSLVPSNIKYQADLIERQVANGIEQYIFSVWAPPNDMSSNGDKTNEVYGKYMVNVLDYITKERGLPPPVAISIQNEPGNTGLAWATHKYSGDQYAQTFIAVSRAFDEAGYEDIIMMGAESAGYTAQHQQLGEHFSQFEKYPEFFEDFDAFCTHSYRNGPVNGVVIQALQEQTDAYMEDVLRFPDKDNWQTEYCGTFDSEDQVLSFMQMFCADITTLRFNYWFWWVLYDNMGTRVDEGEKTKSYQHLYLETDGRKKGILNRIGQAFSTICKNVPVGSHARYVETDDPNAFVHGQVCVDSCAFDTKNGTVLCYVNQNYEDKTYDFNNLKGKTAKIYQFQSPEVRMQTVYEGDIKNGKLKDITLPGRSTSIIVCSNEDIAAPNINFKTDYSLVEDGNTLISYTQEKELVFNMDEPAEVTVNNKKMEVNSDNSFVIEANTTSKSEYRIVAKDRYGNERKKNITYRYIDGYFSNIVDSVPEYYGKTTYNVTGTLNKPAEISVNGSEAVWLDAGKYSIPINLHDGANTIKMETKAQNGDILTNEFVLNNNISKPALEILTEKELTTNDNEYILRFRTDKDLNDVTINGKRVSSYGMDYRMLYNDDKIYDFVLPLEEGENEFNIYISDIYGNTAEDKVKINYVYDENVAVKSTGTIEVKKAKSPITIDGKIDEPGWILNNKVMKRYMERDKSIIHFGLMYDDEGLYVGAKVTDNSYNLIGPEYWHCDCFELFLDGGYERVGIFDDNDLQLFFGYDVNGKKISNGGKAEDYSFIVNEDGSYTVEIKIPWSTLGGKAEVGRKIGFDVQVDDPVSIWSTAGMRAEPMYRSVSIWNGDTYNWSNSAKFGTIILSE